MWQFHNVKKYPRKASPSFCPAISDVGGLYNCIQGKKWGKEILSLLYPIYLLCRKNSPRSYPSGSSLCLICQNWVLYQPLDHSLKEGNEINMAGLG
jgi:hypothetical protein